MPLPISSNQNLSISSFDNISGSKKTQAPSLIQNVSQPSHKVINAPTLQGTRLKQTPHDVLPSFDMQKAQLEQAINAVSPSQIRANVPSYKPAGLQAAQVSMQSTPNEPKLIKAVMSLGFDAVVRESTTNLLNKEGYLPFSRDLKLGPADKLTLVGHGQADGSKFGGLSPRQMAMLLKQQGVSSLGTLSLKGCDSASFAQQLHAELEKQGIHVGALTGRIGEVAISASGRTLVQQDGRLLHQVQGSKVVLSANETFDPYAANTKLSSIMRSDELLRLGHAGLLPSVEKVGGKGSGLVDLVNFCQKIEKDGISNVRVPKFFVVETSAYTQIVGLKCTLQELEQLNSQLGEKVNAQALVEFDGKSLLEMGQLVAKTKEPERQDLAEFLVHLINSPLTYNKATQLKVCQEIMTQYTQEFDDMPVAIRSSGTLEDGSSDSAAGLYQTVLGRKGAEDVMKAVLETISSNFDHKVFVHRDTYQQDIGKSAMACVIQEIFEPKYAGVGFSLNPMKPEEVVINFSEGLGEFVVGAHGQPAKISFDRKTGKICFEDGLADYKFELNSEKNKMVKVERPLAKVEGEALAQHAEQMFKVIMALEEHFGGPVDMEFGIKENGEIGMLQRRAITVTGTQTFKDLGSLSQAAELSTQNVFSGGLTTGKLVHIQDEKTFDFDTLTGKEILLVEGFTDKLEANINRFAGYLSLKGGDLDHGAIVLRQHGKTAVRVSEEDFENLKSFKGTILTLAAGSIAGESKGLLFRGDRQQELETYAVKTQELEIWKTSFDTLSSELDGIQYPKSIDTPKELGQLLTQMVNLNAMLLKCFHPELGGSLGKLLAVNPYFFTTQPLEVQIENVKGAQAEAGPFLKGMSRFVDGYLQEVIKLNPQSKNELQLQARLQKLDERVQGAFSVLGNEKASFRSRAEALEQIQQTLMALTQSQSGILGGMPEELNSMHEIIIRVHRNMFEELKQVKQAYQQVETYSAREFLPENDKIVPHGFQSTDEVSNQDGRNLEFKSIGKLATDPQSGDIDRRFLAKNLHALLTAEISSKEEMFRVYSEPQQPWEHVLSERIQQMFDTMSAEPAQEALISTWLDTMNLQSPPTPIQIKTAVEQTLAASIQDTVQKLAQGDYGEAIGDDIELRSFDAEQFRKAVQRGLEQQSFGPQVIKEALLEQYSVSELPTFEQLTGLVNSLSQPKALELAARLAQGKTWEHKPSSKQEEQNLQEAVSDLVFSQMESQMLDPFVKAFIQEPRPQADHQLNILTDKVEDWQKMMVSHLPSIRPANVVLAPDALTADIALGNHSMEMMAVHDPKKGGDANYVSVRYVDNTEAKGLSRMYIYLQFLEKHYSLSEIQYEDASQGLRFKIPNIDFQNPQADLYVGKVTATMQRIFNSSPNFDYTLSKMTGEVAEFKNLEGFKQALANKNNLSSPSLEVVETLTDAMKVLSDHIAKQDLPLAVFPQQLLRTFYY